MAEGIGVGPRAETAGEVAVLTPRLIGRRLLFDGVPRRNRLLLRRGENRKLIQECPRCFSATVVAMRFLVVEAWALWCGFGLMGFAAVVNARTLTVPNWLSLPAAIAGWLTALLVSFSTAIPSQGGGILSSLAAAAVGFALLVPFYVAGGLGAGCVKMQTAFGAWVGCALAPAAATLLVGLATIVGGGLTVVGAVVMIRGTEPRGVRAARSRLFPAQVTLSLGAIAGVVVPVLAGWV